MSRSVERIPLEQLISVGAHFGHETSRWCPKMARYIWGHKNNVHLIDVSKTAYELERAAKFLQAVAADGKNILWIGTKKAAQESMRAAADSVNMPFVTHRWIGGTLSNYSQVKKSVTKLLHFEDIIAKAEKFPHYTKKELNTFGKVAERLKKNVGGIRNFMWPLGAVVVVDVSKEKSAIKEASAMGIPVVAIVDTNGDPSGVDYVIPANDDAPRVISLLTKYLAEAALIGKEEAVKKAPVVEIETEQQKRPARKPAHQDTKVEGRGEEGQQARKPGSRPMSRRPAGPGKPAPKATDANKAKVSSTKASE